jgi:diguanylate cyclase (GGDEF)-like protein
MRRAAVKRNFSQPATRLVAVAGLVLALVVAQFVLLIAGGAAADREARNAAEDSVEYLADISHERVLNSVRTVDHLVHDTMRSLRLTQPAKPELVSALRLQLERVTAADALSVTYPNGDFVELGRSETRFGEYRAYLVEYGDGTLATRFEVEYDADLNEVSRRSSSLAFGTTRTQAYLGASTSSELAWTGPSYDPVSGRDVVRASLSTTDGEGTVVMVVAANLAILPLQHSLSKVPTGSDGEISVVASNGTVIVAPLGMDPAPEDVLARPTAPAVSVGDGEGDSGGYATVERVLEEDGLDWVVRVRVSASGRNEGFGRLKTTLDVVIGGLMILTIVLGYLLVTMWRPLMAMRRGAERDALMGLYNRRRGRIAAESLVKFARRSGSRVVFVMCDVDNFKGINDALGHDAGDTALAQVGQRMTAQTREGDVAVRWGGDEFLLVLLLSPKDDAEAVVERFRAGAADTLQEVFPSVAELGVTAGFAVSDVVGHDVDALITAADHALVRGKSYAKGYSYSFASHE